jgi:hypothetical protein
VHVAHFFSSIVQEEKSDIRGQIMISDIRYQISDIDIRYQKQNPKRCDLHAQFQKITKGLSYIIGMKLFFQIDTVAIRAMEIAYLVKYNIKHLYTNVNGHDTSIAFLRVVMMLLRCY